MNAQEKEEWRQQPLFLVYDLAYRRLRAVYDWHDEPVLYNGTHYVEPLPPKSMSKEAYSAYLDQVGKLLDWYMAAWRYWAKKRKAPADRQAYEEMCDRTVPAYKAFGFPGEAPVMKTRGD